MLLQLVHLVEYDKYSTVYMNNIFERTLIYSNQINLALMMILPFVNKFSLVYIFIQLFLIDRTVFVEPLCKITTQPELFFFILIEVINEFDLITRILQEDEIANL